MKQIVYISTAVHLMTDGELVAILNSARQNNEKNNLTGVLLYSEGIFIQALEGPDDSVEKTFNNKIAPDPLHKNIIKLLDQSVSGRDFAEWSMGFPMAMSGDAKELAGYILSTDKSLNLHSDNAAIMMINTFITTNNLIIKND